MKKIIFLAAKKADYEKLKSIILSGLKLKEINIYVFATGMHNLST